MRTIERAVTECRAHWKPYENSWKGKLAWNVHHDSPIEPLEFLPSARIDFIVRNKLESELVARLDSFRVVSRFPKTLDVAREGLEAARERLSVGLAVLDNASKNLDDITGWEVAHAKLERVRDAWDAAVDRWKAACAEWANSQAGRRQHAIDAPLSTWNGKVLDF